MVEKIGEGSRISHVEAAANLQAQAAARLPHSRPVDVADRDSGTQTLQNRRGCQPDSTGPASDNNDLVCNRHASHRWMLLLVWVKGKRLMR
jgi:hypothetical protein